MKNPNWNKSQALDALEKHVIINLEGVMFPIRNKSNDADKLIDETADWIYSFLEIDSLNASALNLSEEEFEEIKPLIFKDKFRNFCKYRMREYIEKKLSTMKISINKRAPIQIPCNTWQDLLKYLGEIFPPNEELAECTITYITKDEANQKELRDTSKTLTEEQIKDITKKTRKDL